jgi:hypothetical protein
MRWHRTATGALTLLLVSACGDTQPALVRTETLAERLDIQRKLSQVPPLIQDMSLGDALAFLRDIDSPAAQVLEDTKIVELEGELVQVRSLRLLPIFSRDHGGSAVAIDVGVVLVLRSSSGDRGRSWCGRITTRNGHTEHKMICDDVWEAGMH